jgi:methionyl-tRNA formyltransferase
VKILFLGNGSFGVSALDRLCESAYRPLGAVTLPDRPGGRGRRPHPTPIKQAALRQELPLLELADLRAPESASGLRETGADLWVVVAYPILPAELLAIPPVGALNLHASLLPRYRGAAPVAWALWKGERITGVTTFYLDAGVDSGDICLQRAVAIEPGEDAGRLSRRLAEIGADLLLESVHQIDAGAAPRLPQDETLATPAPRLRKEQGVIDWRQPAEAIQRQVRALNPWPGTWTWYGSHRLGIRQVRLVAPEEMTALSAAPAESGVVVGMDREGYPVVACGQAGVALLTVVREGKRPMSGAEAVRGLRWRGRERLAAAPTPA